MRCGDTRVDRATGNNVQWKYNVAGAANADGRAESGPSPLVLSVGCLEFDIRGRGYVKRKNKKKVK